LKVTSLHRWQLSYDQARSVQERLRDLVELKPFSLKRIRFIAGSDIAVSKKLNRFVAAVVVLSFPDLEMVETSVAVSAANFPYVPGLLSFREIPALIKCLKKIKTPFDVMICDGQGIAHPRGLGLASHLGLIMGIPTVGCAKSRLVGAHGEVGPLRGDYAPLVLDDRCVGSVIRTRDGVKPVYVSPGHLVDVPCSRRIVLGSLTRYRVPEPVRRAHVAAGEEKRRREG
jgi:deoxyribonuclease V